MVWWTLFGALALAALGACAAWGVNRTPRAQENTRFDIMDGVLMVALFVPYGVFKAVYLQKAVIEFAQVHGVLLASIVETATLIALVFAAYFISWSINRVR
jgi:F0F1-type ATP synthase membrane subunit c/vacuolar-type H+-ATPase subunit K